MPPPTDVLPSVKLFFSQLFGVTPSSKGKAPPKIEDISSDIKTIEAVLAKPVVKKQRDHTPPVSPKTSKATTIIKMGDLQKIPGSVFLQNPCILPGKSRCNRWALDYFYESLYATSQKKGITRIGYFGDSIIALDKITSKLRTNLQERFGNSGPGFFHMAAMWKWSRHKQISLFSHEWKTEVILLPKHKRHFFGYGGVSARTTGPGARTVLKIRDGAQTAPTQMTVFYVRSLEGAKFHININGKRVKTVNTRGPRVTGQIVTVTFEKGSVFEVEAGKGGTLELTGILLENHTPGVVLDSISLTGARLVHFANNNPAHLVTSITQRNPNLLIFHFGINESDTRIGPNYEPKVAAFLRNVKKGTNLSCLVAGPSDKVKKKYGEYITKPIIHYIIKVQKKLAIEAGCAFFNTWQAMGGETSVVKWYRSRPRLAIGDLTHITDAGGDLMGSIIYLELMKGYRQWLQEKR
jgi:hypothetical protein